ncbi:cytochrome d ubiquinol oxidase subunit II [Paludibacterium paludis]|uniref:Cytochrome oxidase subunit II n=1 Tax=Paludibacterium paludis TaxID=1225769 RepID=A0A918U9L9_9NEIS|nr:cytochrome d ubiquinol oxidase subunit II [Paludibacterium paludis]GGY14008.1 cytochrome oxidase subunit II [Paludibacterium paludis]
MFDLPSVWAGIIALGVFIYVMLDGFDLGIGILFPFFPEERDRNVMMNTVAPVWDANETWLVLGGAGLFAAFPVVYSAVLSALYLPLILMLCGLIFRGVAFEIRGKARRTRHVWDLAFILGSSGAAFFQGVALGAYIQGIRVEGREFAGGVFDWLTPFSLFTGAGVVITYAALGCGWLIIKTDGDLQRRLFRIMPFLTWAWLAAIGMVSIWTPLLDTAIGERWFRLPNLFFLMPVPLAVLACVAAILRACRNKNERQPYGFALLLAALGYAGFVISIWPMLIPPSVSLWQAAAPESSLAFTLVGAVIIIPVILVYSALGYWVFRGKVRASDEGYH